MVFKTDSVVEGRGKARRKKGSFPVLVMIRVKDIMMWMHRDFFAPSPLSLSKYVGCNESEEAKKGRFDSLSLGSSFEQSTTAKK